MNPHTQRRSKDGRARRRERPWLLYAYVLGGSLVLHLVLLPVFGEWLGRVRPVERVEVKGTCSTEGDVNPPDSACCTNPVTCPASDEPLKVAWVDEREKPEEEEEEEKEKEEYEAPFTASPMDAEALEEIPDEATALGAENRKVEEESVVKGNAPGLGGGRATPSMGPQKSESQSRKGRPTQPSLEEARERLDEMMAKAPALEVPQVGPSAKSDAGERELSPSEPNSAPQGTEGLDASMLPELYSEDLLAAEGGGAIDWHDIDEGEKSLWNQKKHAHSGFFGRVTTAVSQNWEPVSVYRRRDPQGKIYGVQDRLTVLSVTLRSNGTIAEVFVKETSGLDFMDDEAIRAFKAAGPFPNPPESIKDKDGMIRFTFGFMFEITTRKFRAFRYR